MPHKNKGGTSMYSNLGKKIMVIGKILGWMLLIAGTIVWLVLLGNDTDNARSKIDNIYGWLCLIAGILGFLSSWFVCAFGQLVDDVHVMREKATEAKQE
jgi:4-hydroxybenzoate polyprenyltransferase